MNKQVELFGSNIICIGISVIIITFVILDIKKIIKKEHFKYFVFAILFVTYLGYILITNCGTRQHDTRAFTLESDGHLGYIKYVAENKKLPEGDLKQKWCFTNPPLFYIVSAIFVKIQESLGRFDYQAIENLQFLQMFFTLIFIVYVYKIFEELELEDSKNYLILFVGLAPAVVFLSGSLNNDILSILLSIMAIYYTISWYKTSKLSDLIKDAFSISLAIMTKINAGIIAIPIAIAFIIKLFKDKENIKKYILYYMIFGLIALPIGLWFPVRNLIKYDIPLTYVQTVVEGEENDGYIGNKTISERFFKIDLEHLRNINLKFEKGKSDYNVLITTLKSFIVDEQIDFSENNILKISAYILFIVNLIIVINFILSLFRKIENVEELFLYLILVLEIVFYIKFIFDYPYAFSMNIRYIIPILVSIGMIIGKKGEYNNKILNVQKVLIIIYSICSLLIFINL